MSNIKGILAYSGQHYFGWQKTRMGPSIEETVQKALEQILRHPIQLQAASRTDRGVHAEGQVFNFFTDTKYDLDKLHAGLRALLPNDMALLNLEKAADTFHPTLDVQQKVYHYAICNGPTQLPFHREFSWHYPIPLNLEMMQGAAKLFVGTHDFSAFANECYKDPVRTITDLRIHEQPDGRILIEVQGDNFLYKMVRNLVGTLVYVGCSKLSIDDLPQIFESKDRTLAGMCAPADGLCLKKVFY